MSIFNTIPWKAIASFMPTVMELVRDAKGGNSSMAELQLKIGQLEKNQKAIHYRLQMLLAAVVFTLMISIAALVIGIIVLARG